MRNNGKVCWENGEEKMSFINLILKIKNIQNFVLNFGCYRWLRFYYFPNMIGDRGREMLVDFGIYS